MAANARELVSVADARAAVLAAVAAPLGAEGVPLAEAIGRTIAEDVISPESVPGWDNSAMDGYAVRAADTPGRLKLAGESRAGRPADAGTEVGAGEAFRISTGGTLPAGADAVVRVEDTTTAGDAVTVEVGVESGKDVRRAGDDIKAGDRVLRPGTVVGAAEAGVLASVAVPTPRCARRPRVAIVCTGDELLGPADEMRPGGVRNSNAYVVSALATDAGAQVMSSERCADTAEATEAAVASALDADVAIFCGGVSVGAHDHVKDAFREYGVEERFWGVALRPGKPTYFGVEGGGPGSGGALAFGLPGNPVSAFVTFVLFVQPALRSLSGASTELDSTVATLGAPVGRMASRDQAVRCRLELTPEGWLAHPTGHQGSHVLTSMLGADALAVVERGEGEAERGSSVTVQLLRVPSPA